MKNTLCEKPTMALHGRLLASARFVADSDIRGKDILDVGCGFGWFEVEALRRGARSVTGAEISEGDLATARQCLSDPRASFVVAGATSLPLPDASFDTVVAWEVIEHIPKGMEDSMFSETGRVLRPGGTFYLSTPHAHFWNNVFDPAWWLTGHRHYSLKQLRRLADSHGFAVETLVVKAGWWTILAVLNMYIAKWIFHRRPFFKDFFAVKVDEDFGRDGFANVFVKLCKS